MSAFHTSALSALVKPTAAAVIVLFIFMFINSNIENGKQIEKRVVVSAHSGREILQKLPIKHPIVLQHILAKYIQPPGNLPYNLSPTYNYYSGEYTEELNKAFAKTYNGFFVECGARDGELYSSTLHLELTRNWTGILIEAHPQLVKVLESKRRKVWIAKLCVSPNNTMSEMKYAGQQERISLFHPSMANLLFQDDKESVIGKIVNGPGIVPCFPLTSVMAAVHVERIDLLRLDIEGDELKILKTLPFDDTLVIKNILVETGHCPEGRLAAIAFLISKGYNHVWFKTDNDFFTRIS